MALTFLNLQDIVLDLIEMDDTTTRTRVGQFINMAGRDVWYRYAWPERQKTAFTSTTPPYSTGTVVTTQDSATVTGTGTTWTAAMDGTKFALGYDQPWYTITTRDSATQFTLDRNVVEDSASGSTYVQYDDTITFASDCSEVINIMSGDPSRGAVLQPIARVDLDGLTYLPRSTGTPLQYAMIEESSAGYRQARVWPIPDDEIGIQYHYLTTYTDLSADGDTPVLDESRVDLIVLGALRWAYLMAFESAKAQMVRDRYEQELQRTWAHTKRRHPTTVVLRKFDDWTRWRNVVTLPVVDA